MVVTVTTDGGTSVDEVTYEFVAPPVLVSFDATFNPDAAGGPFTETDLFPATVSAPFVLTGTGFAEGATVAFYTDRTMETLIANVATSTTDPDDEDWEFDGTKLFGNTPVISPAPTENLDDVTVVVTNPDSQSTVENSLYVDIIAQAPPTITSARVFGADDEADSPFVVANGPFRNDDSGANGPNLTIEVLGTNLDSSF